MKIEMNDGENKRIIKKEIRNKEDAEKLLEVLKMLADVCDDSEDDVEAKKAADMEDMRTTYLDFVEKAARYAFNYNESPRDVYNEVISSENTLDQLIKRALSSE